MEEKSKKEIKKPKEVEEKGGDLEIGAEPQDLGVEASDELGVGEEIK